MPLAGAWHAVSTQGGCTVLSTFASCTQGAHRAFAFGSGMAALSTVVRLVPSGGHIVAGRDLYGGTSRLLARVVPNLGITVSHVDTANPA